MVKVVFLALTLLTFTSCNERKIVVQGKLTVNRDLTLNDMGNNLQDYSPGTYITRLRVPNKRTFKLSIDRDGDPSLGFFFNIPAGVSLPENGEIEIPAEELGQGYDLRGKIMTQLRESSYREDWRACSYTTWEYRCNTDYRGRTFCDNFPRTVWGNELVGYVDRTTSRDFEVSFFEEDVEEAAAVYSGEHTTHQRVIRYIGQCF